MSGELPENASYEELIEREEQILTDEDKSSERLAVAALRVADYAAQRDVYERSSPNHEAVLEALSEYTRPATPRALFESTESDRTEAFFRVDVNAGHCYVHKGNINGHVTYSIMSSQSAFKLVQGIDESDKTERRRLSGWFEELL